MQSLLTWIGISAFAALAFACALAIVGGRRRHVADELMFTTEAMQSRADRKQKS
jgi:hypothetical protein